MAVMRSGRLHRYNLIGEEEGEVSALEREFAAYTGARYALAVASGGYAMGCALRALGVGQGDKVLSNGFTLAPVPGAIASVGAEPVFVETTEALTIDIDDLAAKAEMSGAKVLLLSHMRGHICDMERLMEVAEAHGLQVIEDCAHTMGAAWKGVPSGRHGVIGCYSTQTYKHINSGEGGLLVSDDPDIMARAIMLSGSYMLFGRHSVGPSVDRFENVKYETPNVSGRMDHLRAAILRPQTGRSACADRPVERALPHGGGGAAQHPGLKIIERPPQESIVGSSIQFLLPGWSPDAMRGLVAACATRGVELKWFGRGRTRRLHLALRQGWRYAPPQRLPKTDAILAGLIDMRLPLTFSEADARLIASIIRDEVRAAYQPETGDGASRPTAAS